MKGKTESEVAQLYKTLSDPMDCSLPGSSIHGIFQAGVLEWGAIAFSEISVTALFYLEDSRRERESVRDRERARMHVGERESEALSKDRGVGGSPMAGMIFPLISI